MTKGEGSVWWFIYCSALLPAFVFPSCPCCSCSWGWKKGKGAVTCSGRCLLRCGSSETHSSRLGRLWDPAPQACALSLLPLGAPPLSAPSAFSSPGSLPGVLLTSPTTLCLSEGDYYPQPGTAAPHICSNWSHFAPLSLPHRDWHWGCAGTVRNVPSVWSCRPWHSLKVPQCIMIVGFMLLLRSVVPMGECEPWNYRKGQIQFWEFISVVFNCSSAQLHIKFC